jgi:hypothetical protein
MASGLVRQNIHDFNMEIEAGSFVGFSLMYFVGLDCLLHQISSPWSFRVMVISHA